MLILLLIQTMYLNEIEILDFKSPVYLLRGQCRFQYHLEVNLQFDFVGIMNITFVLQVHIL